MLLFKTIPLSLSIFWRFTFGLILWSAFYLLVMLMVFLIAVGYTMTYGDVPIIGPLINFVLPLTFVLVAHVISIHMYLTGTRVGLQLLGVETTSSEMQLLGTAAGYGFVEAVVVFAGFIILTFAFSDLLIQSELPFSDVLNINSLTDPIAEMSRGIAFGPLAAFSVIISVPIMAIRAALLPVLAQSVAGRDPEEHRHDPFGGFGQNFFLMMLLMLLITGFSTMITPYLGGAYKYLGLTSTLTEHPIQLLGLVVAGEGISFSLGYALVVAVTLLLSIWLFCLQCAAAALDYESQASRIAKHKQAEASVRRREAESVAGELLRSRMPKL